MTDHYRTILSTIPHLVVRQVPTEPPSPPDVQTQEAIMSDTDKASERVEALDQEFSEKIETIAPGAWIEWIGWQRKLILDGHFTMTELRQILAAHTEVYGPEAE